MATVGRAVLGGVVPFNDGAGVSFEISRKIRASEKSRAETRVGLISWLNIDALLLECFPDAPALPGLHPQVPYLYVQSVDIDPWPDVPPQSHIAIGTVPDFLFAKATITYGTLPFDTGDFLVKRYDATQEVISMSTNGFKWEDGTAIESSDIPLSKSVPVKEHIWDYSRVPSSLESTISTAFDAVAGKINATAWRGVSAETLLVLKYSPTWRYDGNGNKIFTFSYQFKERAVKFGGTTFGWNHFPRSINAGGGAAPAGTTRWQKIKDPGGNYIYDTCTNAQLDALFP